MVFNKEHLLQICDGDRQFGQELIAEFLATAPSILANLTLAVGQKNLDQICREAHQLKGSANAIGGVNLGNALLKLELLGRSHGEADSDNLMEAVLLAWDKLRQALYEFAAQDAA